MWFRKRGIVTSVRASHCVVVTPNGTYEKIHLPSRGAQIGEEVVYNRALVPSGLKPVLMVASFLLVFMSSVLLYQANLNQVAAYVTLDINPSLEISVDKNLVVLEVLCLNEDAANLIKPDDFKGKNLNDAISGVIDKAVEQNYIKPGEDNIIVSTVSTVDANTELVDQEAICRLLEKSAASSGRSVQVKMYTTSDEIRKEACNAGISSGKYLIYKQLKKTGNRVISIDDVKKNSVKQLVDNNKVELPANYRKFTINKDKRGSEPEIDMVDDGKKAPLKDNNQESNGKGQRGKDKENQSKNDAQSKKNMRNHKTDRP